MFISAGGIFRQAAGNLKTGIRPPAARAERAHLEDARPLSGLPRDPQRGVRGCSQTVPWADGSAPGGPRRRGGAPSAVSATARPRARSPYASVLDLVKRPPGVPVASGRGPASQRPPRFSPGFDAGPTVSHRPFFHFPVSSRNDDLSFFRVFT